MKPKELLFCTLYRRTGNAREAAARAGFRLWPERQGLRLLARREVQQRLAELSDAADPLPTGEAGLRRIAFGSVADAVGLLFTPPGEKTELEGLDLFMISEIKSAKGGGLEMKFYDRLKALELLSALSSERSAAAAPLYEALSEGARRLKGAEPG